ncbi:carbohydrate kinase family protein [Devriesea agamarum]|uniref:carbohydrate kinase family protein n=1 Tax=Devriesea agamarum TaxID=472569 RepID=UPI00071C9983|nr:carbohydrate kinase [Devriesea agamarum]
MIEPVNAQFLTVGEALVDIVVTKDGTHTEYPGGSPMNVAVTLGRLGHTSHLLTQIGADARGDAIRQHIEASSVTLTPGSIDTSHPTSTALAELDETGAASYTFDIFWSPNSSGIPEHLDGVHTSSIAAVLPPGADSVIEVLHSTRDHATISYDPNARPALMGSPENVRATVEKIIALSDVVKASDEDIAWMYGTDDVESIARTWLGLGPAFVAVTRGGDGALGVCRQGRVEIPGVRVQVADTVGAGDTFSAGILDALARKDLLGAKRREQLRSISLPELTEVLTHAARCAAITVSRHGANPPWLADLDSLSAE